MAYASQDEALLGTWYAGMPFPRRLDFHIGLSRFNAFNSFFEGCIWANVGVPKYGFPAMGIDAWDNTRAAAVQRNLPSNLARCAASLGLK
jgi:hypothetical protein